ncbi:MAG: hypothetical protein GTO54_12305 [Nitrososphaeria archaeon]|nr:hypothetical protein [Nitrososphaeria archaeon]
MTESGEGEAIEDKLVKPLTYTTFRYYLATGVIGLVILWGLFAYLTQLMEGLGVTGLNTPILWGMYISSFIFFSGVSMAGTLISAVLRITKVEWRRPITRIAEAVTVFALLLTIMQIFFDMGRPDRLFHILFYGRFQSPLVWDLISIPTYLLASILYLYVAMIPDFSIFLVKGKVTGWKSKLYELLSLNWRATEEQVERLEKALKVMASLVIPIAVSVHTVVSWTLAMNLRPSWHSAVFGPYFVTGAIYSGIAAIITAMWFYRKIFKTEEYIKREHFKNLGWLLLILNLALIYMVTNHILTDYYGGEVADIAVLNSLFFEEWAPVFWSFISTDIIIPILILATVLLYRKEWVVNGTFVASIIVNIGMFLERYIIVAPTLSRPFLPYPRAFYTPTWVELSILAASVATFCFLFFVFVKLIPFIPVWEVKELDRNLDLFGRFCRGSPRQSRSLRKNWLPRVLLLLVICIYGYSLYIIARMIIIPIYTPEGMVAASEGFKLVAAPVTAVISIMWFAMGYAIYQLYKITEVV